MTIRLPMAILPAGGCYAPSWSTSSPRSEYFDAAVGKIFDVARRQREAAGPGDGCDEPVEPVQAAPCPLARRDQLAVSFGGERVERKDSIGEATPEKIGEFRLQIGASPPRSKLRQAIADLGDGDGRRRQFPKRPPAEPFGDYRYGAGSHHLRDHVGVEDDHVGSNLIRRMATGGCGRSSTPPLVPKISAARSARFCGRSRSTASRRMRRASSSIEMPCSAARTRSPVLTRSSMFRIVRLPIVTALPLVACNASRACTMQALAKHGRHAASAIAAPAAEALSTGFPPTSRAGVTEGPADAGCGGSDDGGYARRGAGRRRGRGARRLDRRRGQPGAAVDLVRLAAARRRRAEADHRGPRHRAPG